MKKKRQQQIFLSSHFTSIDKKRDEFRTDLSAEPWRGGMSSISRVGSERGAAWSCGRLPPSETRHCEPTRSVPSGGAEERNLGFPSRWERINPKSKVKSGGTEGLRHPDANNPFYELRGPLALSGVLALQGRNRVPVMSYKRESRRHVKALTIMSQPGIQCCREGWTERQSLVTFRQTGSIYKKQFIFHQRREKRQRPHVLLSLLWCCRMLHLATIYVSPGRRVKSVVQIKKKKEEGGWMEFMWILLCSTSLAPAEELCPLLLILWPNEMQNNAHGSFSEENGEQKKGVGGEIWLRYKQMMHTVQEFTVVRSLPRWRTSC